MSETNWTLVIRPNEAGYDIEVEAGNRASAEIASRLSQLLDAYLHSLLKQA